NSVGATTPRVSGMHQIANWLESLGFQEYVDCFAENDIDFSILHDLTDQDLENRGAVTRSSPQAAVRDCRPPRHREASSRRNPSCHAIQLPGELHAKAPG